VKLVRIHVMHTPPFLLAVLFLAAFAPDSRSGTADACTMQQSCQFECPSNRMCVDVSDSRNCHHDTKILGHTVFSTDDPTCEAAKRQQDQINEAQKAACQSSKSDEQVTCEYRRNQCQVVEVLCAARRDSAMAAGINHSHILWVDDHPENNEFISLALTNLGAQVVIAKTTAEALSKLASQRFDVIISDFKRNDDPKGGYTLLTGVQQQAAAPPYIIFSSSSNPQYIADAKRRGAFGETNSYDELLEFIVDALKTRR
jgi:CheY-like chemotaxis protein